MSTSEPFTDPSLECTLLGRSRRSKYFTAMMAGPTAIIKDWPAQLKVQYGGVPILVGGFVACRVVVRSHLHYAMPRPVRTNGCAEPLLNPWRSYHEK